MTEDGATRLSQIALLGEAVERLDGAAIFVWDEDRNYVAANGAACALVGKTHEELLRMKVGDMTADRAEPHFSTVQNGRVQDAPGAAQQTAFGVEVDWLTCRTTIAGLPYLLSICWQREPA